MPKENISCVADNRRRVEVHWQPRRSVQVASVQRNQPDSEVVGVDGIYVDLDRPGVNRLIEMLRRARNSAFGRDA